MVLVSGLVAAAGDRMGHRAARAKIRIGKLRPRTASTVIAVATGVCISILTFGLVFGLSKNFRDALLRFDTIKAEAQRLTDEKKQREIELNQTKDALTQAKGDVSKLQAQTMELVKQIDQTSKELKVAGADKAKIRSELMALLTKSHKLTDEIAAKQEMVKRKEFEADSIKGVLDKARSDLEQYQSKLSTYKQGNVVLPRGAYLGYLIVHPEDQQLSDLMQAALNRVTVGLSRNGLAVSPQAGADATAFTETLSNNRGAGDMLVVISAASNVFENEAVRLAFETRPLAPLVHKGDVIMSVLVNEAVAVVTGLDGQAHEIKVPAQFDANSLSDFGATLAENFDTAARGAGFLPDLKTGEISSPVMSLADVSNDLVQRQRPFIIQFVAKQDLTALDGLAAAEIYISNPKADQ
jgi:hypothetical protein